MVGGAEGAKASTIREVTGVSAGEQDVCPHTGFALVMRRR